jgi:D-alanine-D-alanine ligase
MKGHDIVVLYGGQEGLAHGTGADRLAAEAVLDAVDAVESACGANGSVPHRLAVESLDTLGDRVLALAPDLIFNLVEAVEGSSQLEPLVPWLLGCLGVPYTGSTGDALALALDKGTCRARLREAGLPVAPGGVMATADDSLPAVSFPVIVKPSREDASHGLNAASIAFDEESTRAQVGLVVNTYRQPALVEAFLPGREFTVSILDRAARHSALVISEIDFSGLPAGAPTIVDYRAKWVVGSCEDLGTVPVFCPELPRSLRARIEDIATRAWQTVGLRHYARVDLRLDACGEPAIIDVNPNPDLSPEAGLSRAMAHAGVSYRALIAGIAQEALADGFVHA